MKKEIIVPRKKWISISLSLALLLLISILLLPILSYFKVFNFVQMNIPLFVIIICFIMLPFVAYALFFYFKQLFNKKPVLIVNSFGIDEGLSRKPVGLIRWEDIEDIAAIPVENTPPIICIALKNPEKYITDEKILKRLEKSGKSRKMVTIKFSSLYFKKELDDVLQLMRFYFKKNNPNKFMTHREKNIYE